MPEIEDLAPRIRGPREAAAYDGRIDPDELRAKHLDVVAKAAYHNLRAYGNCCRSTLGSLGTHLRLEGAGALRAASTLAGGIGGTGETCGAVIGALMALGLRFGSEAPADLECATCARNAAVRFVERFRERFGSTRCYEIQEATVGWRCNDPSLIEKWIAADGPIACAAVCAEAARLAADLMLEEEDKGKRV